MSYYPQPYLPIAEEPLPPKKYHSFDNSKARLPQSANWVNPEVPTQFVVDSCTDCGLRIVFCLDGNCSSYFPNNAKCHMSYDVEQIFGHEDEIERLSKAGIAVMPTANQVKQSVEFLKERSRDPKWQTYKSYKKFADLAVRMINGEIPPPKNGTDPQVWIDRYQNFLKDHPDIMREIKVREELKRRTSPYYNVEHRAR